MTQLRRLDFGQRMFAYAYIMYGMAGHTVRLLRKFRHQRVCVNDVWVGESKITVKFTDKEEST